MNYPEYDKLKAIETEREIVQNFIDWLYDESELIICELNDADDRVFEDEYYPTFKTREQIMAMFFDIDLNKLSQEKDDILNDWRKSQGH